MTQDKQRKIDAVVEFVGEGTTTRKLAQAFRKDLSPRIGGVVRGSTVEATARAIAALTGGAIRVERGQVYPSSMPERPILVREPKWRVTEIQLQAPDLRRITISRDCDGNFAVQFRPSNETHFFKQIGEILWFFRDRYLGLDFPDDAFVGIRALDQEVLP